MSWPTDSIFKDFDISETVYKTIGQSDIKAAILTPKGCPSGKRPLIVNLHGGFLINGSSLFAPFFAPWTLELARQNLAITVSADYRLLPSTNGVADILADLEDFWHWVQNDLSNVLAEQNSTQTIDLHQILVTGGSAGGYCATQLALSHADDIRALAMTYPELDTKDKLLVEGPAEGEQTVFRVPKDEILAREVVLSWIEEAKTSITTKAGFERTPFAISAAQHGLYASHIFDSAGLKRPDLHILDRIEQGAKLPKKVWIIHGDDDSIVHVRGTYKFMNLVKEKLPGTDVRLDIASGQDHAFDHLHFEEWDTLVADATEGMEFIKRAWLI